MTAAEGMAEYWLRGHPRYESYRMIYYKSHAFYAMEVNSKFRNRPLGVLYPRSYA